MILGEEITKRLIDQTLVDLRIATNPHMDKKDAKQFVQELLARRRSLWGPNIREDSLDKDALDLLKSKLKNESKLIKVK